MLTFVLIYFFMAVALDMIQFKLTRGNYWVPYNGIGTTEGVWKKNILAPMQYRVLVPLIYGTLERLFGSQQFYEKKAINTMFIYEPLKIIFMFLGLWGFHVYLTLFFSQLLAFSGVLLMAIFWVATFKYDYADCYLEVFFWSMFCFCVLTGNWYWAVAIFILATLNRELTILLIPLYYLLTGYIVGTICLTAFFLLTYLLLFLIFGYKKRIDRLKDIYVLNLRDVKRLFAHPIQREENGLNFFPFNEVFSFVVIMAGLTLLAINYANYPHSLQALWLVNIPFMVLVFLGARITELRVLMPLCVSVIPSTLLTLGGIA